MPRYAGEFQGGGAPRIKTRNPRNLAYVHGTDASAKACSRITLPPPLLLPCRGSAPYARGRRVFVNSRPMIPFPRS